MTLALWNFKNDKVIFKRIWTLTPDIFSCEEAALEVQMLSLCVCLFDPKTEYYQGYAVWSVHKTNWLYKGTQNQFTVQVYTKLVYWLIMYTKQVGNVPSLYIP